MSSTTASTLAVAPALNRNRRGSTWARSGHARNPVLGIRSPGTGSYRIKIPSAGGQLIDPVLNPGSLTR